MTKNFCDRCGKECINPRTVSFSYGSTGYYENGKEVRIELCEDCQKETGIFDFIAKNDTTYKKRNEPVEKSVQEQFFELFTNIVCLVQNLNEP